MTSETHTTLDSERATKRVRIVMVDDDPSEHVLMLSAAEAADRQPDFTFFEDGADALLHLVGAPEADLPDVIVLDLRMPGLDGHRTLDELQADPELSKVPVVVFTSSPRIDDIRTSIDRGAVSYVVKPSGFAEMVSNVNDLCDLAGRGITPTVVDPEQSGRDERRRTVEAIGDIVADYLDQLAHEAAETGPRP